MFDGWLIHQKKCFTTNFASGRDCIPMAANGSHGAGHMIVLGYLHGSSPTGSARTAIIENRSAFLVARLTDQPGA
jgi:hypothetical protein